MNNTQESLMTDHKQALIDLRDKVKAGGEDTPDFSALVSRPITQCKAGEAYRGSLDAAKALHEAVLPGWVYGISFDAYSELYAFVSDGIAFETDEVYNIEPARAWLLAILEALIAQEEQREQ